MIIEFSGIDGSGKSLQIDKLMRWSNESGIACFERKLRSSGRRVLGGIAQSKGHRTWRDLYTPDAVELLTAVEMRQRVYEEILPISFPGQIIVTDTYVRSWIATAISWSAAPEALLSIYETVPPPDLSIHLDVDVDTAYSRILTREKGDHILRSGGHERLLRLAAAYEQAGAICSYEFAIVSTASSPDTTFSAIRDLVLATAKRQGDAAAVAVLSAGS